MKRPDRPGVRGGWRSGHVGTLLLAVSVLLACVQYVPVDLAAVRPDEEVRIRFTDDAAIHLARELGRITPQLDANVWPKGADSVGISIWIGRDFVGTSFQTVRQEVAVGRGDVAALSRRQISASRSALAALGVAGVFAVIIHRLTAQENPNPPTNGGPGPPPPLGERGDM